MVISFSTCAFCLFAWHWAIIVYFNAKIGNSDYVLESLLPKLVMFSTGRSIENYYISIFKFKVNHTNRKKGLKTPWCYFFQQGAPEFLGRAMVRPRVKLASMPYDSPIFPAPLQWWDVYRGPHRAGEILAAFELLQVSNLSRSSEFT